MNSPLRWLERVVGSFSWSAPPWLQAVNRVRRERPAVLAGWLLLAVLLLAGMAAVTRHLLNRPGPVLVRAVIEVPGLTPNVDDAAPPDLVVTFEYDFSELQPDQPRPDGSPSVARLDLADKVLPSGISLSPAWPGQWRWRGDRTLMFTPSRDWPAQTEFTIHLDQALFAPQTRCKRLDWSFVTAPFAIELKSLEFYQDPKDRALRKAVGTLTFSHPVTPEGLEPHLAMGMRPSGATLEVPPEPVGFSVSYDRNQREAYVHSVPLTLPEQSNYLELVVGKGVKPAGGGPVSTESLSQQVLIPDRHSFFKVVRAKTEIIRNEQAEPQQILSLQFSDDIGEQKLLDSLVLYLLPQRNPRRNTDYWESPREVTDAVLREAQPVQVKLIPNERSFAQLYHFVVDVPPGRTLYLRLPAGLVSESQFVLSTLYDTLLRAPDYPKDLSIMGDGSMLSFGGEHRLSLLTRGLDAIQVKVGKLLPGQINHLISQTSGDIKDPYFNNYRFDEKDLADFQRQIMELKPQHPQTANYSSLELSAYLTAERNPDRFGLFFVQVAGWDRRHEREIYGVGDKRLILVTDLGLLVKNNADQSHDLFVQSIRTGRPVAGARVELLGRNGVPLLSRVTAADGHVRFPGTQGFEAEQAPTVYVVRNGEDTSFIPFERSARQLNYSRYDVGGSSSRQGGEQDSLSAFLFSDRGLYRPGETVRIGGIVKDRRFGDVASIPFELVITGPRGNELLAKRFKLPEKGFFEQSYPTAPTSDTGIYQLGLYLVRDDNYRGRLLGSTGVRVEEFQPDSLKIESTLLHVPTQGWTSASSLQARIRLHNLFGTPAQGRKVTGRLQVRATDFHFKQYPDYIFVDPYYDPKQQRLQIDEELPQQQTDAQGEARFTLPLERFAGGTYQLSFSAEGFEPGGGRSVRAQNSVLLSPLQALVGYKSQGPLDYIAKDSERSIDLLAVGNDLQPCALDRLRSRLLEIQQLSTLVQQPNGTYSYQTVQREKELQSAPLLLAAEGLRYRLPTATPGEFLLEILDESGLRLSRIRFSVAGHGNLEGRLEKSAELALKLDRSDYRAGEQIEMQITAPYTGAGLISIESDRVHCYKWFRTTTNSTIETIRIPEPLEGNAYVNVTFVRAAEAKEIFTSPLSYAVAPFTIDRSKRRLELDLKVDERVRPGEELAIRYRSSAPSRLVVFAVDEGILQVAGYRTPQPLDHFLRKRALEVDTLQILDLILPEFDLVRAVAAPGGGADSELAAVAKNLNPFARKLDRPAVFWSGILAADAEERTLSFTVPDSFAGRLRVMAVAVADGAMGVAERSTLARGPFVLTPNVPTQVAPNDRFRVAVGVSNLIEGSGSQLPVTVQLEASEQLEVVGASEAQLVIDEGSEQTAVFELAVKDRLGPAEVRFSARSGEEQGSRRAGLSIRPLLPYAASFVSGYQKDGQVEVAIPRRLYAELAQQQAAASVSPLVLVEGLSSYLEHFPHGCTEQVVSQVFPLVGLMRHPLFQLQAADHRARFDLLIGKLRQRQLADGGFSFWPGGRNPAAFPSVYVMHFLLEIQDLGYPVPADLLARGQAFLQTYAARPADSLETARVRAYALYLLTRMGEVTTNHLVHVQGYLEEKQPKLWKQDLTAVYMAAAYRLLQKEALALELVGGYDLGGGDWANYSDFHSPLTCDAQYLYLLSRHFPERLAAMDGTELLRLIEPIFQGRYNTLASAYSILALGAYSARGTADTAGEPPRFSLVDAAGSRQEVPAEALPFAGVRFPVSSRKVLMEAGQALFYLVSQAGFDRTPPSEPVRQGLEISREYLDAAGTPVTRLEQGREVQVRLRVRALGTKPVSNVAVIDLLPGGFEVLRDSVARSAYQGWADYADVREDRVVFYGSFDTSVKELRYRARVTAAGRFGVPPAYAASMYDRSVRAVAPVGQFEVTAPPR